MSYEVLISSEKYEVLIQHLREIVQPKGAWNNDLLTYLSNVVKSCVKHAESALDLLDEEYQSLEPKVNEDE